MQEFRSSHDPALSVWRSAACLFTCRTLAFMFFLASRNILWEQNFVDLSCVSVVKLAADFIRVSYILLFSTLCVLKNFWTKLLTFHFDFGTV